MRMQRKTLECYASETANAETRDSICAVSTIGSLWRYFMSSEEDGEEVNSGG